MVKNSKVKNVQGNGTWEGRYGLMYKFEVEMENGDHGEYSSKSPEQTKFVVGDATEYEHLANEYNGNTYYKIKPVNTFVPNTNFKSNGGFATGKSKDQQQSIEYQSVLRSASMFYSGKDVSQLDLTQTAEYLYQWLQEKKTNNTNQKKVTADMSDGSDLPF